MIRGFNGLSFVVRFFNIVVSYICMLLLYRTENVKCFVDKHRRKKSLLQTYSITLWVND